LFAKVGGVYANFLLWGISIFPAWLVLQPFGAEGSVDRLETSAALTTASPNSRGSEERITVVSKEQK
jgi:hypothetical protein